MQEISNDDANDLADDILLREEFIPSREAGPVGEVVDRVVGWIGELLGRIFSTLFGGAGSGAGATVAYLLLAVVVVVIAVAVVRAIRNRRGPSQKAESSGPRVIFDEVVDEATLQSELAAARAAGDLRASVIAGFRLAVIRLIEAGVAVERPGATTGDFGAAVQRNRPELDDRYRPAARSFDRAFYSDSQIDAADGAAVDALLQSLDRVRS